MITGANIPLGHWSQAFWHQGFMEDNFFTDMGEGVVQVVMSDGELWKADEALLTSLPAAHILPVPPSL